jgi:hypothetical protein
MRIALACLAAGLLLALAAPAALAQNAGDQQYQDPLAGDDDGGNDGGNGSNSGNGSGSGNTAPGTQTETAQANGDDTGSAQDGLPRTGLDAWLLVVAGTAMLGGGFALRRVADRAGT